MADNKNLEPVHLQKGEGIGDYFLVYGTEKGLRLDIHYAGETLWLTQAQIAELFGRDISVISRHISSILEEGELDEETSLQKMQTTTGRPAISYNLDMVISVGYRVSSAQATLFRRWATGILVQFAAKGFVVDTPRLKQPDNFARIKELREIIREIRSDEANVYRELRRICAMCQDYTGEEAQARSFYQKMQAKLVYAVTSHTPSEIIYSRADSSAENMGLKTWPHDNIRKADISISKNYLAEAELKELNRLTTILLDIFEDQLELGRLPMMQDAENLLEKQLKNLGRTILRGGGQIGAEKAKLKAGSEYAKFDEQRKCLRYAEADRNIAALAKEAGKLPSRSSNKKS